MAKKPATKHYTYGFQRAEVVGAFTNAILLCGLCISIIVNAIQNFITPIRIEQTRIIIILGCIGFILNVSFYIILYPLTRKHKTNAEVYCGNATENLKCVNSKTEKSTMQSDTTLNNPNFPFLCENKISCVINRKDPTSPHYISHKSLNLLAITFHLASDAFSSILLSLNGILITIFGSGLSIIFEHIQINEETEKWYSSAWIQICNSSHTIQDAEVLDLVKGQQRCKKLCHNILHWTDYIDGVFSLILAGFICYGCIKHSMLIFLFIPLIR